MLRKPLLVLLLSAVLGVVNLLVEPASGSVALARVALARPDRLLEPVSAGEYVVVAYGDPIATRIAGYDANGHLRWQKQYPGVSFSGKLKACAGLVCAPAFRDGVYVFSVRDGSLKAHLLAGEPVPVARVACTPRRVCITAVRSHVPIVVAFDTTNFHQVWMREFPGCNIWDLGAGADAVRVVVAKGTLERPYDDRLVSLRAKDGCQLSVGAVPGAPPEHQWDSLPALVRARFSQLFVRREGIEMQYLPETPILRVNGLLAVGRLAAKPRLFVIRVDTGRIVWQRDAPGLFGIALAGDRLVALFAVPDVSDPHSVKRLDGFDFRTGRLLWTVRLGGAQ